MHLYILPVQNVLLEYVIKLGRIIFFPGKTVEYDVETSNLENNEKLVLKK